MQSESSVSGELAIVARRDQILPGQGSLKFVGGLSQPTINSNGSIAFVSFIDGNSRNQAVFVGDRNGLKPIVFGCGDGLGGISQGSCGDPSPIGGTFSGFPTGTDTAPDINDRGDVLFLADIKGGKSPRGLFVYQADSQTFVKVAAVGDRSPYGGTLSAIGPGSMNNRGDVVFPAFGKNSADDHLLMWSNGKLKGIARTGQHGPDGSVFQKLIMEWYGMADGTEVPVCTPGINDKGTVVFQTYQRRNEHEYRLFILRKGKYIRYLTFLQKAPEGGLFTAFNEASINNSDDIAFFAELDNNAGWYTGHPGKWRKVLTFTDRIGSARIATLAASQNPVHPLNNAGDVVVWARLEMPNGSKHSELFLKRPNEKIATIVRAGDPGPAGRLGEIIDWPDMSDNGLIALYTDKLLMLWKERLQ